MDALEGTREKILLSIKTRGPQTAADLGERLGLTAMGVRQHLHKLEEQSYVAYENEKRPKGRPAQVWRLTEKAATMFPEGYADLALEILEGVRQKFGEDAVAQLIAVRTEKQIQRYRDHVPGDEAPLLRRVTALARLRTREGYMAECAKNQDGTVTLIENNCPICVAARTCQRLCGAEVELFRSVLGEGVDIERREHILEGARRCTYVIGGA